MTTGLFMMGRMQTLTHPAGIAVRPAAHPDLPALVAMVERCSLETVYRRFHGVLGSGARRELTRIAAPTDRHRSWVAVGPDGAVHGTATLAWGRDGSVEVAFMVEDARQRCGIGRALVTAALAEARRAGLGAVTATIQGDNIPASLFLRAIAPDRSMRFDGGDLVATVPLAAVALQEVA
jgi:GNAT superfamily N-acetyltransferase